MGDTSALIAGHMVDIEAFITDLRALADALEDREVSLQALSPETLERWRAVMFIPPR